MSKNNALIFDCLLHIGLQLLQKVALYELLKETTPYLLHPNLWIRQATASFVSSTASILDGVDVVVKLGTILTPFLKRSIVQMENTALIMANLESPISRLVLDAIIKTSADVLQVIQHWTLFNGSYKGVIEREVVYKGINKGYLYEGKPSKGGLE